MNNILKNLINSYIGDTGSLMLYYDFNKDSTGYFSSVGDTYSVEYNGGVDISNNIVTDNPSSNYMTLVSGATTLSSYTPNIDDTAVEAEAALDPLNQYGLNVSIINNVFSFEIDNTGTAQKIVGFTYNGMSHDPTNYFFTQDQQYHGYIKNNSPSSTVPNYSGVIDFGVVDDESTIISLLTGYIPNEVSGANLSKGKISLINFSGDGFFSQEDLETESTFLFSFEKTGFSDGILFGCLKRDEFDKNGETGVYGRGFNIGVNCRNKLFFQGIDPFIGEYILTANELELSNKNICSVSISPNYVNFGYYNLSLDYAQEQIVASNASIENPYWNENLYLGYSDTYYKNDLFPGYIDEFAIFTGVFPIGSLKSISSGFISTGISSSNNPLTGVFITGYETTLLYPTGITGYQPVITGYREVRTTGNFIDTTRNSSETILKEGERFFTGFFTDAGDYIEEVGFLVNDNLYKTTGNSAHATLGLKDIQQTVQQSSISVSRSVENTGYLPIFGISGLTGFLYDNPTGVIQSPLFGTGIISGSQSETLDLIDDRAILYRKDYLYFLGERL